MTPHEFEREIAGHPTDISYNDALDLIDNYDLNDYLDRSIINHIKRLNYCERLGVAPYPGTYEDQPKDWLNFLQIYDYCVFAVKEYRKVMNGTR